MTSRRAVETANNFIFFHVIKMSYDISFDFVACLVISTESWSEIIWIHKHMFDTFPRFGDIRRLLVQSPYLKLP